MRVLVCGGRHFSNRDFVFKKLNEIAGITCIIHGAASGADTLGALWAKNTEGVSHIPYKADWDNIDVKGAVIKYHKDGRAYNVIAGHMRNQKMIDEGSPDLVLAFPGGSGTADMINRAKKANIPVHIVQLEQKPERTTGERKNEIDS